MGFKLVDQIEYKKLDSKRFAATIYIGYSSSEIHWSGYSAAELAEILSEGDSSKGMPPRPHLEEGIKSSLAAMTKGIGEYFTNIIEGDSRKTAAQKLADLGRKSVDTYARSDAIAENARYTIEKKGSDQPLIERGELLHMLETKVKEGSG